MKIGIALSGGGMRGLAHAGVLKALEEKGIKQTWLAEKLGKSFSMVNAYACNRRQPNLELLFEIANILQVDPKDLIGKK